MLARGAVLLFVLMGCGAAAHTPLRDLTVEQQHRQLVWIDVYCDGYPDDGHGAGTVPSFTASGGIVSSRHVLTARHLLEKCRSQRPRLVAVVPGEDGAFPLAWYRALAGDQVLLQRADAGSWPWAQRPRVAQVMRGDRVCAETASPLPRRQCGEVLERYVHDDAHGGMYVRYGYLTRDGNSGSLLYDRLGHLVGVHSAGGIDAENAYMVPVDWRAMP